MPIPDSDSSDSNSNYSDSNSDNFASPLKMFTLCGVFFLFHMFSKFMLVNITVW